MIFLLRNNGLQQFLQSPAGAMQHDANRRRPQVELPGDGPIAQAAKISQTKHLGLLLRQLGQGTAKSIGQLGGLGLLHRPSVVGGNFRPIQRRIFDGGATHSSAEPVQCPTRHQAREQRRPVPHRLAARNLKRRQQRVLDTVGRVVVVV